MSFFGKKRRNSSYIHVFYNLDNLFYFYPASLISRRSLVRVQYNPLFIIIVIILIFFYLFAISHFQTRINFSLFLYILVSVWLHDKTLVKIKVTLDIY